MGRKPQVVLLRGVDGVDGVVVCGKSWVEINEPKQKHLLK